MWAPICDLGKEKEIKSMKIKRKVQKTLPQLIEWVIENKKFNTMFNSDKCNIVLVSDRGTIEFTGLFYDDTFTITTEEEITEDTEIELLLEVRNGGTVIPYYNESIKSQVDKIVKEYHTYIDGEFKLIWRNGKLVE